MKLDGWDQRPGGGLLIGPIVRWDRAVIPMAGLLRLEAALSEDQLQTGRLAALQVTMTAHQARLLAQDLLEIATLIENQPKGTAQ